MKRSILVLSVLILLLTGKAQAAEPVDNTALAGGVSDAQIQQAMEILARAKIIVPDAPNYTIKLHQGAIDRMRAAGKLEMVYASFGSFCQ